MDGIAKSFNFYLSNIEQERLLNSISSSKTNMAVDVDSLVTTSYAAPPVNKLLLPNLYLPKEWNDSLADFWVDSLRKRWSYEKAVMLRDSISSIPDLLL